MSYPDLPVWTAPELGLPPLTRNIETPVCVVGLGGTGLAALSELSRLGIRGTGIDAHTVAHAAAGRNGGLLLAGTTDFYHEAVRRLSPQKARELYDATVKERDEYFYSTPYAHPTGSLRLASSADEYADIVKQYTVMRDAGLSVSYYDGPQGQGLLFEADGVFSPKARHRALARSLLSCHDLFEHTPLLSWSQGNASLALQTPKATIHADRVIVAVDGRLETLFPTLAVQSVRLQMLATSPTRHTHPIPAYSRWGYDYWQQLPDGSLAIGGGRDHGTHQWLSEQDNYATSQCVQSYLDTLKSHLAPDATVTHRWAAYVGYTDSYDPICTEVHPNLWALGGYSGTGNLMGAVYARRLVRKLFS